jgi:hypothetical protein
MTVMDDYLDTAMEAEDVFPCKGCGEVSYSVGLHTYAGLKSFKQLTQSSALQILEEGKAFELGMVFPSPPPLHLLYIA